MRRRFLLSVAGSLVGLLFGGVVGLVVGLVAGFNASTPQKIVRWMIVPLFGAMLAATLLQGRLEQDLLFGQDRPLANALGLALIVVLTTLLIEAILPNSEEMTVDFVPADDVMP